MSVIFNGCQSYKVKEINFKQFNEFVENRKTFILYIGSTSCHNCVSFSPKFESVVKEYKIDNAYYIDLDSFNEADKSSFNKIINVAGTPNVVFITNGEEQSSFNRINGDVSKDKIIERLKSNDYIK